MSPKSNPENPPENPPPNPPPALPSNAAEPNWSYCLRLLGSDNTL